MIKPALAPTLTHAKNRAEVSQGNATLRRVYGGRGRPEPWRHGIGLLGVGGTMAAGGGGRGEGARLSGRFAVMIESTITSELVWP